MSSESGYEVSVDSASNDGSAAQPSDYVSTEGTLTLSLGSREQAFSVPVVDKDMHEGSEDIYLTLRDPQIAVLGSPDEAILAILDDIGPPLIPSIAIFTRAPCF